MSRIESFLKKCFESMPESTQFLKKFILNRLTKNLSRIQPCSALPVFKPLLEGDEPPTRDPSLVKLFKPSPARQAVTSEKAAAAHRPSGESPSMTSHEIIAHCGTYDVTSGDMPPVMTSETGGCGARRPVRPAASPYTRTD